MQFSISILEQVGIDFCKGVYTLLNTTEFSNKIPCKNLTKTSSKASSAKSVKVKAKKVEIDDDEALDPIEEAEGQERYFIEKLMKSSESDDDG